MKQPIPELAAEATEAEPTPYELFVESLTDEAIRGVDSWSSFRDRARATCPHGGATDLEADLLAIELVARALEQRQ